MTLRSASPLVLLAILLAGAGPVAAQLAPPTQGAAVYRYVEPGTPTMDVRVWGAVGRPGVYQVARDTDLVALLTLAGGPMLSLDDDRLRRNVSVQLTRYEGADRTVVSEMPLEALTRGSDPLPGLSNGDVVTVNVISRSRFTWRDALSIVSSAGTVALLVIRITERL
jgi:protein involved in polysaccharide export with SLBB domain